MKANHTPFGKILFLMRQYLHPRMIGIFVLGISTGIPLGLVAEAMQNWLWEEGLSRSQIGLLSLATLPYAIKIFWGLVVDDKPLPALTKWLGRRRSWAFTSQSLTALFVALIASIDHGEHFWLTLITCLGMSFVAVLNYVTLNAYRIESFPLSLSGISSTMGASGYRLGKLLGTAGVLLLATFLPWSTVYYIMAITLFIIAILVLFNPEPSRTVTYSRPKRFKDWFIKNVCHVWRIFLRYTPQWKWVIAFLFIVNLGDHIAASIINVFYRDLGFSKTELVNVTKLYALGCTLLGGFIGGHYVHTHGYARVLKLGIFTHSLTILSYIGLAYYGYSLWGLALCVSLVSISDGIKTAGLMAYVTGLCSNTHYTAAQYALLSSFKTASIPLFGWTSGLVVDIFDWKIFFSMVFLLSLPPYFLVKKLRNSQGAKI